MYILNYGQDLLAESHETLRNIEAGLYPNKCVPVKRKMKD